MGSRKRKLSVQTDTGASNALCATIGETTPSEKLVNNRGRGRGGTCLIASQLRLMQIVKTKVRS